MNGAVRGRGQASLPALALALLILSSVTVLSLAVANGALAAADRTPTDRHVASSVADRLVAESGTVAVRANVLDGPALDGLNASRLRKLIPVSRGAAVRVTVGDDTVVENAGAHGGTVVRRIVVVRRTDRRTITPTFGPNDAVTLPRRTDTLTLEFDLPDETTVRTVRANGRVLLRNPDGIAGEFELDLSRFETARLRFTGSGPLYRGNGSLTYTTERTRRAILAVTADG